MRIHPACRWLVVLLSMATFAACSSTTHKTARSGSADSAPPKFSGPSGGFCDLLRRAIPDDSIRDPEQVTAKLRTMSRVREQLVASAPEELRDDVAEVLDGYQRLGDELGKVDNDFTKLPESALGITSAPAFRSSSARVIAYADATCVTTTTTTNSGAVATTTTS